VAEAYRFGTLASVDLKTALAFYHRAAAMGHADAKEKEREIRDAVSVLYERALELYRKREYNDAFKSFSHAAAMGHASACFCLGVMYAEGIGAKKDAKNAVYYYRLAAEQGNIDAIYRLGAAYAEGFGVRRDFKAAESFFGIAAKQGYRDSAARIETIKRVRHKKKAQKVYSISSVLYRKGEVSEAIRFRSVAAKLGNPRAMYALGCHYEFGDGVPMDRDRAQGWYTYAGNAGFKVSARSDYKGGFLRERKLLFLRKKNG
jgi:TPR repeat protein